MKELTRVRQYFEKIKKAEEPPAERTQSVDTQAAIRFIKADLVRTTVFFLGVPFPSLTHNPRPTTQKSTTSSKNSLPRREQRPPSRPRPRRATGARNALPKSLAVRPWPRAPPWTPPSRAVPPRRSRSPRIRSPRSQGVERIRAATKSPKRTRRTRRRNEGLIATTGTNLHATESRHSERIVRGIISSRQVPGYLSGPSASPVCPGRRHFPGQGGVWYRKT